MYTKYHVYFFGLFISVRKTSTLSSRSCRREYCRRIQTNLSLYMLAVETADKFPFNFVHAIIDVCGVRHRGLLWRLRSQIMFFLSRRANKCGKIGEKNWLKSYNIAKYSHNIQAIAMGYCIDVCISSIFS